MLGYCVIYKKLVNRIFSLHKTQRYCIVLKKKICIFYESSDELIYLDFHTDETKRMTSKGCQNTFDDEILTSKFC